ncbi:MAG TPA: MlaD family protein [Candidatus Omnitrophota bacterium]|nr:MlaD family protein [Candidatus Omnitrophota bacterium]
MDSSKSYSSAEVKLGFYVIIVIVLLLALTFKVGGCFKGGTDVWQIRFGNLNGLEDNAPVYYAGHEVGKVERIDIRKGEPRPVIVTVKIKPDAYLRKDSVAYIDTLGMMGEKFVELSLGSKDSPALPVGSMVEGVDPIPMHVLIRKMNLLADQMSLMADKLNPLLTSLDPLIASLNPMASTANSLLEGHKEEISKSITNLHEITINLRDMTHDLKLRPWRLVRKGS